MTEHEGATEAYADELHAMAAEEPTPTFHEELRALINRMSMDSFANTPDYILAGYLQGCLDLWDQSTMQRDNWFGLNPSLHRIAEPTTAEVVAEKRADDV